MAKTSSNPSRAAGDLQCAAVSTRSAWLVSELKHAARDHGKALFVCLHHPVFSADAHYSGSPAMKELLDAAVMESGAYPDIVFGAHVHNYQCFTRTIDDQEFTYIVAGAGGYWHLHSMAKFKGAKVTPPFRQVDDPMSYWRITWTIRMGSCGSKSRMI
jgi:hypothetical protein